MQKWKKLGRIFEITSNGGWMISHAAVPTLESLEGDDFRVYFGTRNINQQASIGYFEIDIKEPNKTKRISSSPVLAPGELGTFDDSGVLPSWILECDGKKFLYYVGWNLGVTVPFRNFIGLATSDNGSVGFKRISRAPIADRDDFDPFFFTNPCVLHEDGTWKMWYLSAVKWTKENGEAKHYYHIKYDESSDGLRWQRNPSVAIDFRYENEYAISRPCVLRENGIYKMWYSYRAGPIGDTYRIGYAESPDGKNWIRKDEEVLLSPSEEGWDSSMIEYPYVLDHKGKRYMLYNGNGYGETGIGLAVLEQD
jgi:predicted GH43/DUF377 family glycosyl hydrolase